MLRNPFIAVAVAGTVLTSAGAHAAWQIVDINARVQTEVDLASANRKDGVVTGWVQHTYSRKTTTQTGAYFVYRTMKEQVRLDCSQNTLTVLLRGYFDDDGSEIASIKGSAEPRAVMPDTPEHRVLARLCNPTSDIAKALRARATAPATRVAAAGETDARFMDGPATQARTGIIRTSAEAQTAAPAATALAKPAEKADAKPAEKGAEAIKIDIRPSLKAEAEKTAAAMAAAQAAAAPKEAKGKDAPAGDALAVAPRPPVRDVSNPHEARAMKARAGAPLPPAPLARPQLAMLSDGTGPAARAAAPVKGRDAAPQAGHVHDVRWGYEGDSAPYRWGDLHPEYATCKQGLRQSPIDIRNPVIGEVEPIRFHYEDVALKVTNNGHTIQVDYAPGSFILFGGSRYELVQFHFHSPSEERINGRVFDMVAHLVHRSPQGRVAVVAVLLTVGAEQPMLQQVWNAMPSMRDRTRERLDVAINASQLLPADRTYYSYMGSLTTPPCTEGVQWLVMRTPVEISREQLAHFTALYPMNARPLQAHNDRLIKIGK